MVLPIVHRLWAHGTMGLSDWVKSWLKASVSAREMVGVQSKPGTLRRWRGGHTHGHVFVAGVIGPFDTVDGGIHDCVLNHNHNHHNHHNNLGF